MLEVDIEFGTHRRVEIAAEIEIIPGGTDRHRSMEKPGGAEIDPAEELPVALQVGMQHVVKLLVGKALQQFVQPFRTKHQQHHQPVVVGMALGNAGRVAHRRAAAVAPDNVA
jgi:hypothetical protein